MCTVSYVPKEQLNYILTSNRDENVNRAKALDPKIEKLDNIEVLFPKDSSKNGTWVGVTNNKRTLCLLNGAFEKHTPTGNYVKSRGLIVLDFFKNISTDDLVNNYNLDNIEPFTLVIIDVLNNIRRLTQLKWDGSIRYIKKLDPNTSHIWSSSTLYNTEESLHKETIFNQTQSIKLNADSIFKFHEFSTIDNPILMKYNNTTSPIETISTTQIESFDTYATLKHKSFNENKESISKINFK
jgi:hypothetical protein